MNHPAEIQALREAHAVAQDIAHGRLAADMAYVTLRAAVLAYSRRLDDRTVEPAAVAALLRQAVHDADQSGRELGKR